MVMSKREGGVTDKGNRPSRLRTLIVALALLPAVHMIALDQVESAQTVENKEVEFQSQRFRATAYCDDGLTKSGELVAVGMVAADPKVLPLGSVVCIEGSPEAEYDGIYQVMDTGRLVRGSRVDIYIPSLKEAVDFGIRPVQVTVLRKGFPGSAN